MLVAWKHADGTVLPRKWHAVSVGLQALQCAAVSAPCSRLHAWILVLLKQLIEHLSLNPKTALRHITRLRLHLYARFSCYTVLRRHYSHPRLSNSVSHGHCLLHTPHLPRLLAEAADQGVAVWAGAGAIIIVLHNDGLLAGILAGQ